jgi:hypothetical protein
MCSGGACDPELFKYAEQCSSNVLKTPWLLGKPFALLVRDMV